MIDNGLAGVENPSEMLLSERPANSPGTCVACVIEGTRPVLAEVQALVAPTSFNVPRRTTNGVDFNRAMLLLAVLEKRGGLRVGACDAYINVIGGLNLNEPGADLPTVIAIASSYRDRPVGDDIVAIGEVGLTGEIRSVNSINQRLSEVARLGFKRCIIPAYIRGTVSVPKGLEVIKAKTIGDALRYALD
jgi:DNA repair protein RadA/Sms